ncbi:class II aldolase/adducin family protein [Pseudonocardia sp.]|uniref:class II aldolase/adducin family protein n=1 Tax=Pseudonocardia sp. TaxID=60912 RepID=UPI0026171CFA|nr:class II aldolase/adducin family protein [Pseudonocardia sp.]MCW2719246.1 class aldolase/adducin family protein [Pseudonocardia sp.]MDT7613499.1 3-dehydro-4-phosphotetronate decarboxylase [Pseudonocardiales bacterium]
MTPHDELAARGASLFRRGLAHGRTGNLSVRVGDEIVVTPSGVALDEIDPGALSTVALDGTHLAGPAPSKEAFLHAAAYRARPDDCAVVHLHSVHAVAVSCLPDLDPTDVLPPLTPYYAMRVGVMPLLPYHAPGDRTLEPLAEAASTGHRCYLIARHGPVVAGSDLATAVDAAEELEHSARLHLMLRSELVRPLDDAEVRRLREL